MFGDKITIPQAVLVALFSITVVFLVLLAISYLIRLIAKVVNKEEKPKTATPEKSAPVNEVVAKKDDDQLLAIISAAVASYLGTQASSFVVKSITPLNKESDWSRLSRTNALH